MGKTVPLTKSVAEFVRFHLGDKHCFSPFTGQDYSAWYAFVYAVELYGRSDMTGRDGAIKAMGALVACAQQKPEILAVFKKAIPSVLDWHDERELWMQIGPGPGGDPMWPCLDGERICAHESTKPYKAVTGYRQCKDCGCVFGKGQKDEEVLNG
jgi:hypothetical protein